MPQLRQRIDDAMVLRGFAVRTREAYLACVTALAKNQRGQAHINLIMMFTCHAAPAFTLMASPCTSCSGGITTNPASLARKTINPVFTGWARRLNMTPIPQFRVRDRPGFAVWVVRRFIQNPVQSPRSPSFSSLASHFFAGSASKFATMPIRVSCTGAIPTKPRILRSSDLMLCARKYQR